MRSLETKKKDTSGDSAGASAKAAYQAPRLIVHGSVKDLTASVSPAGGGDGATMMNPVPSDPALKENIVRIGRHPAGFGIYLFDYKPEFRDACGHARQFGVMADEVEAIVPEAVAMHANGYLAVNYAMIGVTQA